VKERKVYICEKCGLEFNEFNYPDGYDACKEHENSHVRPEPYAIMNNGTYRPDFDYPITIAIPMEDGEKIVYIIEKDLPATGNSEEGQK